MFPHRNEAQRADLERQLALLERGHTLLEQVLGRLRGSATGLQTTQLQSSGPHSSTLTVTPPAPRDPRSQGSRIP